MLKYLTGMKKQCNFVLSFEHTYQNTKDSPHSSLIKLIPLHRHVSPLKTLLIHSLKNCFTQIFDKLFVVKNNPFHHLNIFQFPRSPLSENTVATSKFMQISINM